MFAFNIYQENPRRLHEIVVSDPLVATRVFHWTVRLVIKTLFNCADKPGKHADNIPSNGECGVFGHVRAFYGVVEPQMRKALHLHMLIQLLGFMHPDDLFEKGNLHDVFKRLWYYVASVCFRSTEGFANYLKSDLAMQTLQELPLLPLTPKQRGMIGEDRVAASFKAQLQGRGLRAPVQHPRASANLAYFPSSHCANPDVNASSWSAAAVVEVHDRTRKTGNHVCKPYVCHKGHIGKKGFCRMYFWHWSKHVDDKNQEVARRMHGLQLHKRWNGSGAPPIGLTPPFIGSPALETTHPFHFKMTPSMLLGPQCNHDLGVLLRMCQLVESDQPLDDLDVERIRNAIYEAIGDHEHYSAAYSSKEQPHMDGLLVTIAEALKDKEREIAMRRAEGLNIDPHEAARQILHRLQSGFNRRMHKGFPEMLTYILRLPMEYSSHKFVTLNLHSAYRRLVAIFYNALEMTVDAERRPYKSQSGSVPSTPQVRQSDYPFRPTEMESFPLYFFMAATEARKKLGLDSLDWKELRLDNRGADTDPNSSIARQHTYKPLMSSDYLDVQLRNSNLEPLFTYDYYIHLLVRRSWRVPVLYAVFPKVPGEDATDKEKGQYSLMMMLLFKPHRSFYELLCSCGLGVSFHGSEDDAWSAVYKGFQKWRSRLERDAKPYYVIGGVHAPPAPLSYEWWCCVTYEKMRNYDAIYTRHSTEATRMPTNLSNLPCFQDYSRPANKDNCSDGGRCAWSVSLKQSA